MVPLRPCLGLTAMQQHESHFSTSRSDATMLRRSDAPPFHGLPLPIGLLFLVSAWAHSLSAAPASPLTQWLNAQTNIQTWEAEVTQTRTLKTLAQPLVSYGHVWFAAPNRFRWEIGNPAQTIAVRLPEQM